MPPVILHKSIRFIAGASRQRGWIRRGAITLLALALTGYLAVLGTLWWQQENLLFQPEVLPADHRFDVPPDVHEVFVDVPGARLHALHMRLPRPDGVVFYLHGNGGSLQGWFVNSAFYRALNVDLFMIDYRGYGKSTGRNVDEAQLLADARAAWQSIAPMYAGKPVVFFGRSLGSGLAAMLAASMPKAERPDLLVLVSPYTSLRAMAASLYPYVPTALLRYPVRTDEALRQLARDGGRPKIALVHGRRDELIPFQHSQSLAGIAPGASLHLIEGAGHGDLTRFETYRSAVSEAIDKAVRPGPVAAASTPR